MKTLLVLLALVATTALTAQSTEFATQNGLIYSDNAISKLKRTVDSLNIKFRTCDPKIYYSAQQGIAQSIVIEGKNARSAAKDIAAGLGYDALIKKYPEAKVNPAVLGVRHEYKNYRDEDELAFEFFHLRDKHDNTLEFSGADYRKFKDKKKGWFYSYSEAYSNEYPAILTAYYFANTITGVPLNDKYARLVQYTECMVDTTAQVYLDSAIRTGGFEGRGGGKKMNQFLNLMYEKLQRPEFEYDELVLDTAAVITDSITADTATYAFVDPKYDRYLEQMDAWEAVRLQRLDSLMNFDVQFKRLFEAVVVEAHAGKTATNNEFEECVERYISKEQALYFKRSRRVVGSCSMDSTPRLHALNIAELAAETANWQVFLRSHLDIMNDRFDRVSDGSYAWRGRQTYIKEIEVLGINVSDLLRGISMRVENPSANHYFGSISRIGRSLAEAESRSAIEEEILSMIADNELDDYNRVLMYYLFLHYNSNINDEELSRLNTAKLDKAVAFMPAYITK